MNNIELTILKLYKHYYFNILINYLIQLYIVNLKKIIFTIILILLIYHFFKNISKIS